MHKLNIKWLKQLYSIVTTFCFLDNGVHVHLDEAQQKKAASIVRQKARM